MSASLARAARGASLPSQASFLSADERRQLAEGLEAVEDWLDSAPLATDDYATADILADAAAKRPTWDVLNGWDRVAAKDVAYYQGSTTGDAVQSGANAGDMCRGTGNLVTWHVDRECHTLEASTMDEMCRRMLVISADDMSPDVLSLIHI